MTRSPWNQQHRHAGHFYQPSQIFESQDDNPVGFIQSIHRMCIGYVTYPCKKVYICDNQTHRSGGLFVQGLCRPMFASLTTARGQVIHDHLISFLISAISYALYSYYDNSLPTKVFEKIRENFKYANSSGVDQQV